MSKEERRQRVEKSRQEREAQVTVLRQIRDNPQATPGERLEAIKMLMEIQDRYFYIL